MSPHNQSRDSSNLLSPSTLRYDLTSGIVVFLVALPLCLGIALASGAPLFSGLLAGIIGGLVIAPLSGSHTSVSGPAAGLTAVVAAQIAMLGSFEAFLLAVFMAGVIQVALGIARAGALSSFFPSSVIKGLLAAIGVILILKQFPHVFGHDADPEGDLAFHQIDNETTFSELGLLIAGQIHWGASVVGLFSIGLLLLWDRWKPLKDSGVPGPLAVVLIAVGFNAFLLPALGDAWAISGEHLVQIPVLDSLANFPSVLTHPDFSQWVNPAVYSAAITIALVASLETLLNLEAVDKLDKLQRHSPPSRELIAQGCGNMIGGLIGALPTTSVIIRSSVNVNTGAKTKLSAIAHGVLLLSSVALLPAILNMIPLAALAAILLVTGFKLASPKLFRQMYRDGWHQFLPFVITVTAIVLTDLLVGIGIGLAVSLVFILARNLRRPVRRIVETHSTGDVLHIELADQVSFLNRASLSRIFHQAPNDSHVLIDATDSEFIDSDVLSLVREFRDTQAPARNIKVSLRGFKDRYQVRDEIQFADYSTLELKERLTPEQALDILEEGNQRFCDGKRLARDFRRQIDATAGAQNPFATVLSCIDSRVPAELIFDQGIGDIFSVRVAGNVLGDRTLGSIEYGVAVAGVKLVLVLGHTRCGAVTESVRLLETGQEPAAATGCHHLSGIVGEIQDCVGTSECSSLRRMSDEDRISFVNEVVRRNVLRTVEAIPAQSQTVEKAIAAGEVIVAGAVYDVASGKVEILNRNANRSCEAGTDGSQTPSPDEAGSTVGTSRQ